MRFAALDAGGAELSRGAPTTRSAAASCSARTRPGSPPIVRDATPVPYPFSSGAELLAHTTATGLPISGVMLANEAVRRPEAEVRAGLLAIWAVMQECVARGVRGDRGAARRAQGPAPGPGLRETLERTADPSDPLHAMEWVTLYALAVNEENAAGGRVVTAPTNGAAGIIPAVLHYYTRFVPGAGRRRRWSGSCSPRPRSGCCSRRTRRSPGPRSAARARSARPARWRRPGWPRSSAARPSRWRTPPRSAIEHNLGLTCDPVGGLVQIPCIERNAIASVKAITAARMAVRGDGVHHVSLDKAIKTMRETGADMKDKYKETARGGLALNVVEC